jgi:hypothetical protein
MRSDCCGGAFILLIAVATLAAAQEVAGELTCRDDFRSGLGKWIVEQQPGGKVSTSDGSPVIEDSGGCTVWFRSKLRAPVLISYAATVASKPRLSDLNCFWMAADPSQSGDLFAAGHQRDGSFSRYDTLRTYCVGYGGNDNSTTRFRRYTGDGSRPLLPEHNLKMQAVLLVAGHDYRIELSVVGERVQFRRDGE